jgi:hypothetical protein
LTSLRKRLPAPSSLLGSRLDKQARVKSQPPATLRRLHLSSNMADQANMGPGQHDCPAGDHGESSSAARSDAALVPWNGRVGYVRVLPPFPGNEPETWSRVLTALPGLSEYHPPKLHPPRVLFPNMPPGDDPAPLPPTC